jgi:molecular chaperone GrpE
MAVDPTHHDPGAEGAQADLPESPPGVPEGHDGADGREPLVTEREAVATEAPPAPAPAPPSAEELERLTAQAAKADEYLALAQRKQAEFENFRKRSARETALARERGATMLARELLPAVDNLERALEHAPEDADEHGFVAGVRHVHSDLVAALHRAGIEQYSPQGEPFDPTLHEAVAQQPIEGAEAGTVVEVFQRGYRVGETVVRPARVVVAA